MMCRAWPTAGSDQRASRNGSSAGSNGCEMLVLGDFAEQRFMSRRVVDTE